MHCSCPWKLISMLSIHELLWLEVISIIWKSMNCYVRPKCLSIHQIMFQIWVSTNCYYWNWYPWLKINELLCTTSWLSLTEYLSVLFHNGLSMNCYDWNWYVGSTVTRQEVECIPEHITDARVSWQRSNEIWVAYSDLNLCILIPETDITCMISVH